MASEPTVVASGPSSLALATRLLQRARLAAPTGGIWEAADVQWWSRLAPVTAGHDHAIWLDDDDEPTAAVLRTDFDRLRQIDVIVLPGEQELQRDVWDYAVSLPEAPTSTFPVRRDDTTGIAALTAAGYRPADGEMIVQSWLAAGQRPPRGPLPAGYVLVSRADSQDTPHPLAARNGAEVAERLQRCTLYRPELDLQVRAPDGRKCGYALFWADPITRVGLVEPMRTEEEFQHRGIASHLLAVGLDRLAGHGCDRFKVSNDIELYLRAGFRPLEAATAASYARPATRSHHR
jgi:predicted N-acetyltransferase YhbS